MNDQEKDLTESINQLSLEVKQLSEQIRRQNSFRRNFGVSTLRGLASALGATVVFGLVLASVIQIVRSIDYVPILNNILSSTAIEELVSKFTQPL